MPSDKQQLASALLKIPVHDYITALRGEGLSWATIAFDIQTATKGKVRVTGETIRQWSKS
jgi:hypothetical protein